MNEDLEDFEDWSHPGRQLTLPRRRTRIHWGRLLAAAIACGLLWGIWHMTHVIHDAYQTVYGP